MIKNILFVVSFFIFGTSIGQHLDKQILFSIDDEPVYTTEFLSVYNKNIDLVEVKSERDIDEYLQMFIDYKLKIKEAEALGLDENPKFQREFLGYRNQLAKKFMTDSHATEALVREAYNRTVEEVNAAHILLMLREDAAPEDTLEVYNRAMELRDKITKGADFATIAKQFSEDPSVYNNAGELGWFSAFKMVYPFEDAAYKTEVGEISMPIRTNFGYHLIKINNRRKSKGEVTVAHIMISDKRKNPAFDPKEKIEEIYAELQESKNFEELAKKYSDDKVTAVKGGKLNTFGAGKLNSPVFEDVAFKLRTPGELSEPFKSKYGWHIIKLIDRDPIASFEEMRASLEKEVKEDERSRIITDAFIEKIKDKYEVSSNGKSLSFFQKYVQKNLKEDLTADEEADLKKKIFVEVKDTSVTYLDFFNFIKVKSLKNNSTSNLKVLVKQWHEDFINDFVLTYHQENLEEENEEFAAIAKEYKEGILLFDLMEEKIWNAARVDTTGLKRYYQENIDTYDSGKDFEEIKGIVINNYQVFLEDKWLKHLHETYTVEVNKKVLSNLKKSLGKD